MFSQASVILFRGGVRGGGGVHGRGVCMAGGHAWQGGMFGRGHAWQRGMHGRGHVWQGDVHGRGCAWQGGMHGREGYAWQEAGETTTAADGTHPTGMHSCLKNVSFV